MHRCTSFLKLTHSFPLFESFLTGLNIFPIEILQYFLFLLLCCFEPACRYTAVIRCINIHYMENFISKNSLILKFEIHNKITLHNFVAFSIFTKITLDGLVPSTISSLYSSSSQ